MFIIEEIIPEKKIGLHLSESEEAAIGVQQTQSSNNDCRITIEDNCWVSKFVFPFFMFILLAESKYRYFFMENLLACRAKHYDNWRTVPHVE